MRTRSTPALILFGIRGYFINQTQLSYSTPAGLAPVFQYRYKLDDQSLYRQTTGHTSLTGAKESVIKLYEQVRFAQ